MKTIKVENVAPKVRNIKGQTYRGYLDGTYSAEITPGQSIRIFGTQTNRATPEAFDKTFNIGDEAEYHSYNLHYTGTITAIGPKTVTIQHYPGGKRVSQMDLYSFIRRNWKFDSAKIAAYNSEELMHI